MSAFEPMSETELHNVSTNCASEVSLLSRLVRTALHHLARAKEVVIRITSRDPALLALPFGARLALVRLP